MRAYTNMDDTESEVTQCLRVLREALKPEDDTPEDVALCSVECFVAVALRVMKKTNPSKVRSCARTVEIQARMDGKPVLRDAA